MCTKDRRDGDLHPVQAYPRNIRPLSSRFGIPFLVLAVVTAFFFYDRQRNFSPKIRSQILLRNLSSMDAANNKEASRESTEATELAAVAAAELVDTLDAAREAADRLKRVAAVAAHKRRVIDRVVTAAAAAASAKGKTENKREQSTDIASVRERKISLKDGSEATFSVFGRSDEDISIFVLPYNTKTKRFTLIEEYHPGPNRKMIGLVAGMFESKHGSSLENAAIWELSEEARLKIGEKTRLISLAPETLGGFSQDKYSSAHFRPFLALDCEVDERPRKRDREEDITVHRDVSAKELHKMLHTGKLNVPSTAFTLMGLSWLEMNHLI